MAIVRNTACPECQANGHDRTGNHLIIFDDGSQFCNRSHFHKSGRNLYVPADGNDPILEQAIDGKIKYTVEQFNELLKAGKLHTPKLRAVALAGMRQKDAWEVMTADEQAVLEADWEEDIKFFNTLPIKNLVTRGIKGTVAKFYNVRVGVNAHGEVDRHYYPRYSRITGGIIQGKCRTLPKDFTKGTLGRAWGEGMLFGQNTIQEVMDKGRRKDILIITGGELDAMAAQQMLTEAQAGTKYEGVPYHIWSPMKGENISELIANKEEILQFKKIYLCFDSDERGQQLTKDAARLFRDIAVKIIIPAGCKDANDCLQQGRAKEFVDAFWNPSEVFTGGKLKRVAELVKRALVAPKMGLSWPWPDMDPLTFGIRDHQLIVMGAGTGVGKTETTKEIAFHLMEAYGEEVAVIYLEEQAPKTVRSYAGKLINKELSQPAINDKSDPNYSPQQDYTLEEAEEAILRLEAMDKLIVAETGGNKDLDTVMELLEELVAMGIKRIVLDNLTAIELPKGNNAVTAIDEAMKRIGSFKDDKPVTIILLSHLNRPKEPRKPHEMGGEVQITDLRGAGSISFWADVVIGIERNTYGMTAEEKRLTTYRIVKCRERGLSVNQVVRATKSPQTGRLLQVKQHLPQPIPQPKEAAEEKLPVEGEEF